jgi:hypothetical protein
LSNVQSWIKGIDLTRADLPFARPEEEDDDDDDSDGSEDPYLSWW